MGKSKKRPSEEEESSSEFEVESEEEQELPPSVFIVLNELRDFATGSGSCDSPPPKKNMNRAPPIDQLIIPPPDSKQPINNLTELIEALTLVRDKELAQPKIEPAKQSRSTRRKKRRRVTMTAVEKKKEKMVTRLSELINVLEILNIMIGMEELKEQIVNQILFFVQGLQPVNSDMMMHTVISGKPGSGKTTVGEILAKIYKTLGFISTDRFTKVERSDLVGQYLGETAIKTKKALLKATPGVIFIDEAYSLGNPEGRDSFAKECVDTLNQFLSENAGELVCIIAGYKDSLEMCFFKQNPGLARRFPWRYHIPQYKPKELYSIFKLQNEESLWTLNCDPKVEETLMCFFRENKDMFINNGGDTKNFLEKCKISHARRIFCDKNAIKKELSQSDIQRGCELFLNLKKDDKNTNSKPPPGLYL